MGIEAVNTDFWTRRTQQIVANLYDDEMLNEGLGEHSVEIYPGYPRLGMDQFAIFVYRATDDEDEYAMGGGIVTIAATWQIVCIARHVGDPAELETIVSRFSANVHRSLWEHMGPQLHEDGHMLWEVAQTGAADAAEIRTEEDQYYEIERIPLQLTFQLTV